MGCIYSAFQPAPMPLLEDPVLEKECVPIARVTMGEAELSTQVSWNGGDEEAELDRMKSISSSVLSLSHDSELQKPYKKPGRKTMRSTSTSVDLDLMWHESIESHGSRTKLGNRSFSADSSSAACVQGLARFQDHFRFPIQGGGSEGQTCALRACQGEDDPVLGMPDAPHVIDRPRMNCDIMRRVHSKHGQQYFHYRMFPKEPRLAEPRFIESLLLVG
eukprot:g19350.t1